jgi:hypothetical protein
MKLNPYLLDFFKHGDATALTRDNGIKQGDVWFRLKDFSLVLATVVTSLAGFIGLKEGDENLDKDGAGDNSDGYYEKEGEEEDADMDMLGKEKDVATYVKLEVKAAKEKKRRKKVVADSWEDDDSSSTALESETEENSVDAMSGLCETESASTESVPSWVRDENGQSLVKVCRAFKMVQSQFDEKFRKMWA